MRRIRPVDYLQQLYDVQVAAFSAYPEKYRPSVDREVFFREAENWSYECFAAFSKEDGVLRGYSLVKQVDNRYAMFSVQKTTPAYEKFGLNAALVYKILLEYKDFLDNGGYICDGERSVNHETAFQEYLEKYFGFRKAYCRLHMKYRPLISVIVKMLLPFRKMLLTFDEIQIVHNINSVLRLEMIYRSFKQ